MIKVTHVKDDTRMQKFINHLNFFNEIANMSVSKSLFLHVFFYSYILSQPSAQINLTVTSFPNRFKNLNLLFWD